ncbi:MAG: hypothetical protein AAB769_01110, partial [Patescibacteria group bacterium]
AFQRTIQDAKIADGTYVGNPATVGEIKKDLAAIGVTVPDVPKKIVAGTAVKNLARTTPRAIPKERTPAVKKPSAVKGKPAVSKYAEIGSVKNVAEQPAQKLPEYVLRKKIANADEEIADLELRLKNAEKKGDADTAIWANARIMTERRKIADAEKALLTHPNVLARNNAPVTAKISPTRKPKKPTYPAYHGDPGDWKPKGAGNPPKDFLDGDDPKKFESKPPISPTLSASKFASEPKDNIVVENNTRNNSPFINSLTANIMRQGNPNFGETPYTVKTTVEFPSGKEGQSTDDINTVRSLLGTHSPEELIAMVRQEQSQQAGEEKRRIKAAPEVLSDGDKTPSSRARVTELETRIAELDATVQKPIETLAGAPENEAQNTAEDERTPAPPAFSARELRAREFAKNVSDRTHLLPFDTITVQGTDGTIENDWVIQYVDPYTNEVIARKRDGADVLTKTISIDEAERLNPRAEVSAQQAPAEAARENGAGQPPANQEMPQVPEAQTPARGPQSNEQAPPAGGGRPPEGPPAGVAFQREVAETFEQERTRGQRIGSWLKERAKGLFTFGWWETHIAEKVRVGTKVVGRDLEAQSRLVRQEEGLLSEEEALAETTRMRELFAMSNMEAPSAGQYEGVSRLVTSEKIAANRHIEDTMAADAIRQIEERFHDTKRYDGTPAITPESLRAIEDRIRNSVGAMRRGQADDDILNFTRRVRGALDKDWWKRYIATGVEMVLAAAAFKFVASYAAGAFGGADPTSAIQGAKEMMRPLKDTIWGEAKRILIEQGVPNPTDSQVMDVSKVIAGDSGVGVGEWDMTGSPIDTNMKAGTLLHIGKAVALAARMVAGTP